jgi:hypothetical protein
MRWETERRCCRWNPGAEPSPSSSGLLQSDPILSSALPVMRSVTDASL